MSLLFFLPDPWSKPELRVLRFSPVHAAHSILKGIVGVILNISPVVEMRVRFRTVPFNSLNLWLIKNLNLFTKNVIVENKGAYVKEILIFRFLNSLKIYIYIYIFILHLSYIHITFEFLKIHLNIEYLVFSRYVT